MDEKIKITKKDREDHQRYISESLPCIEQLKECVGEEKAYLDFTPESLKFIDEFVKDLKKEITWHKEVEKFSDQEKWFIVRLAYYLAEVLIRNNGASWELDKTKSSFSFGRSVIKRDKPYYQLEPLNLVLNLWKQDRSFYEWYGEFNKLWSH